MDARTPDTLESRQAIEAQYRSDQAKSKYLAIMSHELKTLISSNIGAAELLLEETFGALNEKQAKYVKDILLSGNQLLQLVNDILDISKTEAGKTTASYSLFKVTIAIEEVLAVVRSLAYQKSIRLQTDIWPSDLLITADSVMLRQVLYNLLSNAIKFSHEGGEIQVAAFREKMPRSGVAAICIVVEDHGVGIAEADLERVFIPYEQADNPYSQKYGGSGLGLALSKKQIELHDGEIYLQSRLGEGTKAKIYFPLRTEHHKERVVVGYGTDSDC